MSYDKFMTVNEAVTEKMEELRREERVNSWYRYRSMLRALEEYGGGSISFDEVTPGWLASCEAAWRRAGRSSTTVSIYMKSLRCVFNRSLGCPGPFARYRIPRPAARHIALSSLSIKAILQWIPSDESLAESRDLWLFSYLCNGINFKDMLQLRYSDIHDGEIRFVRSKTRFSAGAPLVCAHVTPLMQEIIDRRGAVERGASRYIFGYLHGDETPVQVEMTVRKVIRRCNSDMRRLAAELHIPRFTTYAARHSFATVLQRRGVSVSYISECLGHSSIRTTEAYLAGFEADDRERFSEYLTDF